jgi:hypothetical protein
MWSWREIEDLQISVRFRVDSPISVYDNHMTPWIFLGVAGWLLAGYFFYLNQKAIKNMNDALEYIRELKNDEDLPR